MMVTPEKTNMEYLISKYLLKQLLNKGLITPAEFQRIDAENRKSFAQ
ncbi:SHOCT domain-containing protein [Sporomusa termitida]|nr:SHOCT domain-containing protein [Sporomusa termitida]